MPPTSGTHPAGADHRRRTRRPVRPMRPQALAALLDRWLDPATTWWTAVDTVCPSAFVGMLRRRGGVKVGTPDVLVFHRGKRVGIEIKTRKGGASESQEAAREPLLAAGADWWLARSPSAATEALRRAGVAFRTIPTAPGAAVFGLPAGTAWESPDLEAREEPTRECRAVVHRRAPAKPRGIAQYRAVFAGQGGLHAGDAGAPKPGRRRAT